MSPNLETPAELAEWLADQTNIYGVPDGSFDHDADCPCRICWVIDVEARIRASVENARVFDGSEVK